LIVASAEERLIVFKALSIGDWAKVIFPTNSNANSK
jgi:hypothetical protein